MEDIAFLPKGELPPFLKNKKPEAVTETETEIQFLPKGEVPPFMKKQQPEESGGIWDYVKEIPRVAGQALRGAASVPINLAQMLHGLLGPQGLPPEHPANRGMTPEQIQQSEQKGFQGVQQNLQGLEQGIESLTPQPKTAVGKEVGEAAETLGTLLFPGSVTKSKLTATAARSGVAQLAKFASKQIGLGEETAEKIKLGTLLATSLFGGKSPKQVAGEVKDSIKEQTANTFIPRDEISKIGNKVFKEFAESGLGATHGGKQQVGQIAEHLMTLGNGSPKVPLSELIEFKRDLFDKTKELGQYGSRTVGMLKHMGELVDNLIKKSPEVPKELADAIISSDALYSGAKKIEKVFKTIKSIPQVAKVISPAALGLFGYHSYRHPEHILPTIGGAAVLGGTLATVGTIYQIAKSPALQKHYIAALTSAARENKGAAFKHLKALDKGLNK